MSFSVPVTSPLRPATPVLTYRPPCSGLSSIHPRAAASAIGKARIAPPLRTAPRQFAATATVTASRTIRSVIRFGFIGFLDRGSRQRLRNTPLNLARGHLIDADLTRADVEWTGPSAAEKVKASVVGPAGSGVCAR